MENEYYVTDINNAERTLEVAKNNPECKCFYDYHQCNYIYVVFLNLKIGQKVTLQNDEINLLNKEIYNEIVEAHKAILKRNALLEKKYPDLYPQEQTFKSTEKIIDDYLTQRKNRGEKIDTYIVGIVSLLSYAMGLKVSWRHKGTIYEQSGFEYPEQIQDIVGAMYEIISDYLDKLKDNEEIVFELCEHGFKGKDYYDFTKEIEKRTGVKHDEITSDLKMQQYAKDIHSYRWRPKISYKDLLAKLPTVYISKQRTSYYIDRADNNAEIKEITPKSCAESYKKYIEPESQRKNQSYEER